MEQGAVVASMSGAQWVVGVEAAESVAHCHFLMCQQLQQMAGSLYYRFLVVPAFCHNRGMGWGLQGFIQHRFLDLDVWWYIEMDWSIGAKHSHWCFWVYVVIEETGILAGFSL